MSETKLILAMTANPNTPKCGETLSLQFTATNTTDELIDVTSLVFTFELGQLPTSLSQDFSNVTFKSRQGGWLMHQKGGQIIIKPANPQSGQVGPKGLEFDISGIHVNDEPGTTAVTLGKTIGPDKTHSDIVVFLTMVYPTLEIRSFSAVNSNILYDTAPVLNWEASLGAAITLSSPNGTITHVKGHPETPLPSSGSYTIDTPLIQNTNFTLTANANALSASNAEAQRQTMVSITPPAVQLSSKIPPNAQPLEVALDWQIEGATSAQLTSNSSAKSEVIAPNSSTTTQRILKETTFTLTAQNPVNRTPTSATTTIAPTPFGWLSIAPDEGTSSKAASLYSTHAGLAKITRDGEGDYEMYISENGFDWTKSTVFLSFKGIQLPSIAHTQNVTYICFSVNDASTGLAQKILSSTDMNVWTELPNPPNPKVNIFGGSLFVDDAGNLYSFSFTVNGAYLKKFSPESGDWEDLGGAETFSAIHWFAGKFWVFECDYRQAAALKVLSSQDGKTWTQSVGPSFPSGFVSRNVAVFQDHLCLFYIESSNAVSPVNPAPKPAPFALWRMSSTGVWTQDTPVPDVTLIPTGGAPDVACSDGVLFTIGTGYMDKIGGIWACTLAS